MKSKAVVLALVLLSALSVGTSGCGGRSGGSHSTGTGGSTGTGVTTGGTPLDPAVIRAATDAADAQFTSIVAATTDHAARNAQMAAWLKARPEFTDAGVTPNVDSVWAILKNGQLFVATSSFIPGEDDPTRATSAPAIPPPPVPPRSPPTSPTP